MRSLHAVPFWLVFLGLSVLTSPGLAQRGAVGGRAASAMGRPAGRMSPAPAMRMSAPPLRTSRVASVAPASRGVYSSNPGSLFPPPGITTTRPVFYSNGTQRYGDNRRDRRNGYGGIGVVTLGYPVGYPGYLGFDYDPDFLDPTYNPNTTPDAAPIPEALAAPEPVYPEAAEPDAGPYRQPGPAASPYAAAPNTRRAPEPAPLPEEDAVTIVYKDGRPPEQVRNYAVTRTALYITTGRVRTIPIDQIDVPATEAANAKAGVDFHLPSMQ